LSNIHLCTSDSSQTLNVGDILTAFGNFPCDSHARIVDFPNLVIWETSSKRENLGFDEAFDSFIKISYIKTLRIATFLLEDLRIS